jgi:hypothetical protein
MALRLNSADTHIRVAAITIEGTAASVRAPLRLNLEELCRRDDLATLILPDLKQVVIPADEVIRTAGDCAFKDSVIRGVIHDHVDALLRLDVLGKPAI